MERAEMIVRFTDLVADVNEALDTSDLNQIAHVTIQRALQAIEALKVMP